MLVHGLHPLMMAAAKGRTKIVRALVEADAARMAGGATVPLAKLADSTGCTALHAAGQAGRQDTFDALLQLGADAAQRNAAGEVAEVKQSSAEKRCVM